MISLLRRAHASAAASPLHSSASSAGLALPLRSMLLSSAAAASLRPPSDLRSAALSPLCSPLMQSVRCSSLVAPLIAHHALRSFHCSSQTRAKAGSGGSDATSQGRQAKRPEQAAQTSSEQRSQQSKGDPQRKAQRNNGSNGPRKGAQQTAANHTAASAASNGGQSERLQSTLHQLRALSFEYVEKFPAKRTAITDRMDITQKPEWQSMRTRATQLLDSLLQQSSSAVRVEGRLTLKQCERMLFACKDFRLVEESLLVLRAMLETGVRIPAKCVSLLLECVVKSVQWSAASGEPAPRGDHPALSALHSGRAPPSADLCGVELALWMLASMLSPTLRDRFVIDVLVWTTVLDGLIQAAQHDLTRLQRARAFYERIPNKSSATHNMMLTAYSRAGLQSERDALMQLIQADPIAGASPGVTTAHLAQIHHELNTPQRQADQAANRAAKLTDKERALLHEASQLWSAAMERPAERMDVVVTGGTLKVWALLGDIPRMLTIIGEAIEAEQAQSLVLVDPACYGQLFDSLSESADPARWKAEANDAWEQMQQRHADAQKSQLAERAMLLRLDEATLNAYMRYLQLTQQRAELDRVWLSAPRHLKEANPHIFQARLKVLAEDGDAAAAERIISEMPSFNVRPDEQHFAAWIGCCMNGGRCAEAERVWQRMLDSGVKSHPSSYRNLFKVYMRDGSPTQVAKIDPLYAEMLRACPEDMEAGDYQHLIKTARTCRLPSEARKWSERAKAAGLWKDLDAASHTIVATVAQWQSLPRDSKAN